MQAARVAESWLRLALAIPDDASFGIDPARMTREQRAAERATLEAQLEGYSAEISDEGEDLL
jgi:hypothetical protein